jgi:peptidoglycan/LPS O-acetylase OafA/YrhL
MSMLNAKNSSVRFVDSWASVNFDLLRGLAAFLVFFGHWRNLLFVDFPSLTTHRRLLTPLYVLAGGGHQAVVLFFILSGYFIGGTVLRALERDQWEWTGYLLRRIVRLWTVLVPALLLCLFWDRLGIHLGHAPALYGGHVGNNIVLYDTASRLAPHIFFGNLFFLQTILTPFLGTNGALWSLANEFWYYVLFPLGMIVLWRTSRLSHRLICAALFAATAWFVGADILLNFLIWLAGVALFLLPAPSFAPRTGRYLRIGATLIYLPIFFFFGRHPMVSSLTRDYLLTVFTFPYLWVLLSAKECYPAGARSVPVSRELARFSYTLYAAHVPFLVFLTALVQGDFRWYPTPIHLLSGAGLLITALGYAYVLAFLTEFKTDTIRLWLEKLFGIGTVPHSLPSNPLSDTVRDGTPITTND